MGNGKLSNDSMNESKAAGAQCYKIHVEQILCALLFISGHETISEAVESLWELVFFGYS